jgi:hypothetical protein
MHASIAACLLLYEDFVWARVSLGNAMKAKQREFVSCNMNLNWSTPLALAVVMLGGERSAATSRSRSRSLSDAGPPLTALRLSLRAQCGGLRECSATTISDYHWH